MKRIGNFLFTEASYPDTEESRPLILAINSIVAVYAITRKGKERTTVATNADARFEITGEHDDNIIELSKLLEKPTTINQTFDTIGDIDVNFEED